MSDHVYKIIQVAGSSTVSIEDAIQGAIHKAGETLRNLDWFEVCETRGHIRNDKVGHYQVILKIGFRMDS